MLSAAGLTTKLRHPPKPLLAANRRRPAGRPRPGGLRRGGLGKGGFSVALAASLALHLAIMAYLLAATFEPRYRTYGEEVTSVELIRPVPPPPPPPPPPKTPSTPPPKLQPRPPAAVTELRTTVPPLPVPPVVQRIEEPRPPVIAPPAPPAPAPAPAAEPRPAVVLSPDWLRRPTAAEVARYYPERAQRMNVEGRATIACTVDGKGGLQACVVVSESPGDEDFGQAALRMSRLFKMRPMTRDGAPVSGAEVRIPIRFVLPQDEMARPRQAHPGSMAAR